MYTYIYIYNVHERPSSEDLAAQRAPCKTRGLAKILLLCCVYVFMCLSMFSVIVIQRACKDSVLLRH